MEGVKRCKNRKRCHLSRCCASSALNPTTSEKKKGFRISCLNFAETRVKKYVKMLCSILTRNNSNLKLWDTCFAKTIIFITGITAIMSMRWLCFSFVKEFLSNSRFSFDFWLIDYCFLLHGLPYRLFAGSWCFLAIHPLQILPFCSCSFTSMQCIALLTRLAQTVAGWQAACEDRQNFWGQPGCSQ